MLDRLKKVMSAMFTQGVNKLETPELLAEEAQMQLEKSVKDMKEAVTGALTNEKMLEQKIKKGAEDLAMWEGRAGQAVQNGDDAMARECLKKKQEIAISTQSLNDQLAEQKNTTVMLKERYKELEEKLREFRTKKQQISARSSANDSVAKANEMLAGGSTGGGMDKWEQKIREKEIKSELQREVDGGPVEDKFKAMDEKARLDDELAALKAQISPPKLIVDVTKTVVDENVPMVREDDKPDGK